MSRHVVLMSRDTSLGVALKALLSDRDQISELESPKGWRSLNGAPVDVVVMDLPPDLREAALDALETRFRGPLVVLADPDEDLGTAARQQRYSVLRRPFGMAELWSLLVASAPDAAAPAAAPAAGVASPPAAAAEIGWNVGPRPSEGGEARDASRASGASQASGAEDAAAREAFPAGESRRVGDRQSTAAPAAGSAEPAWRWRRRRFQEARKPPQSGELTEPMSAVEANGSEPDADQAEVPLTGAAIWDAIDEAPRAVAARLAERLRADVVALMLDNGEGVLETAGGVGLPPAERHLQVEYGHDVLSELFRVGVGLINDTVRVRGIIDGIPFGRADTLMMVPLVYEGHGFGVLLAGRCRHGSGGSESEFTELEIEALMDFAEDVAPALRSAVLLRRLKGQLDLAEGL